MAETLRIGIVGAGGIVKERHLPGFAAIEGVQVTAVCNRSRASSEAVARDWFIPHVIDDWRDLVTRDDLDIVLVGTWPYLHRDVTVAALAAGKHVFCQARMTTSYADARHLYEVSRLSDKVTALCPPPHHLAVDRLVRKLLADGALGQPRHVCLKAMNAGGADPSTPPTWRQIAAYSGINAMTFGIWIEVIHKWCGYCREVTGRVRTWVGERPSPAGGVYRVSIPDSVRVLAEFESGAEGAFEWSAVAHHAGPDRLELYGDAGTLVFESGQEGVWYGRAGDSALTWFPVPPELAGGWRVEANFIDAVRHGDAVETDFYQGLKYTEFLEATYRSSTQGTAVRLPLGP